jgi:hypothetical protein
MLVGTAAMVQSSVYVDTLSAAPLRSAPCPLCTRVSTARNGRSMDSFHGTGDTVRRPEVSPAGIDLIVKVDISAAKLVVGDDLSGCRCPEALRAALADYDVEAARYIAAPSEESAKRDRIIEPGKIGCARSCAAGRAASSSSEFVPEGAETAA